MTTLDGPPRDRYGRPKLFPRGHDPECAECAGLPPEEQKHRKSYTRASSMSDYLADYSHLWKWKMRYLARSIGYHRDLAMLAAAETYTTGFDKGDEAENRASGRRLDDIIERALDRQGISEKADYGTAVHAWTEPGNDGFVFPDAAADVNSYWAKVEEIGAIILGTELFTANDALMIAGTFDNLKYIPGYGICITDKKTSKEVHGADFRIQLAGYAGADLYDWETDRRMTLEEYVESLGWDPALLNRKDGFIFHIKGGKTEVVRLDLEAGLEAAQHAAWVRDHHKRGKHMWQAEESILAARDIGRMELLTEINAAKSVERLTELWNNPEARASWTDAATAAAKARRAELEAAA